MVSDTPFPIDVITSDSMSPALMQGDIIMWTPIPIDEVQPGDIVIYNSRISWPDTHLVAHRVVNVSIHGETHALITKGDANRWPDQSGPHIPEPEITEENYVGTMVTLGTIPLKIPILGNIGIILTQGMDILSQAARSKDIITYLGVFLPLTIAFILLFLSLLLLPDKAKTLRDKIRLLIFKEKGITFTRMAGMLLLCFFLLSTCTHFFAYDSFEATIGINETPDHTQFSFGQLQPGQTTFPKQVPLVNPGIMPLQGFIYADTQLTPFVNRHTFYLPPGKYIPLNITATAALNAQNGLYHGTIKIYSSALWLFLPEPLIASILSFMPLHTVYLLDILSAIMLTSISLILMFVVITINYQRQYFHFFHSVSPKKTLLLQTISNTLHTSVKKTFIKTYEKIKWIGPTIIHYPNMMYLLPTMIIAICCAYLLHFNLLSIFIITPLITTLHFLIRNNTRQSLVSIASISSIIGIIILFSKTLLQILFTTSHTSNQLRILTNLLGLTSSYLLLTGILLIPIILLTWILVTILQNLKEYIDPLHRLEGRCNL
jgi:signal peptidase I